MVTDGTSFTDWIWYLCGFENLFDMVILYLTRCGINHIIIYVMENTWCGISLEETKYSRCLQRWNYTRGNNTRGAEDSYAGIIRRKLKVSSDLKCHSKETYWREVSPYIYLWVFNVVLIWLLIPWLSLLVRRYLASMLRLWVYEYLNDRFGQVGDVGIMCPATIFKLLGITNIRNTSLWNYTCIYAWNYFTWLSWNYHLLERT